MLDTRGLAGRQGLSGDGGKCPKMAHQHPAWGAIETRSRAQAHPSDVTGR